MLGYWPEEEPGLRPDEAVQGAGFVPFKVWARTEDAALSPDGVWQGEANSPDCTRHSKSGVFAEPTSPEWREVVSGPKPKNFTKRSMQLALYITVLRPCRMNLLRSLSRCCGRPAWMAWRAMRQSSFRWLKSLRSRRRNKQRSPHLRKGAHWLLQSTWNGMGRRKSGYCGEGAPA